MQVASNTDRPRVEISVRQTQRLSKTAKAHPEQQAVAYIERAFKRLNIQYKITWDLPPVPAPDPHGAKKETLDWWVQQMQDDAVEGIEKDADLLLTSLNGGGITYTNQRAAICPAGTLTKDFEMADAVAPDDPRHCLYGILHELGHALSASHDDNWGETEVDDENQIWYRTPTVASVPNRNRNGDKQRPKPKGYTKLDRLYYPVGARDHLLIR